MSDYRVTFGRVTRAEWGKLAALRSTWIVFGLIAGLTVGLAGAIGWSAHRSRAGHTSADAIAHAFLGVDVFSLVLGVFGILLVTGEYGSGLIRATFAAVPKRLPVLWAKAIVLTVLAAPLMLVVCLASYLVSQVFLPTGQRIGLGDGEILRATFGAAAAPVGLALVGLAIGALLRHTAVAITVYVLTMLVLPAILNAALPQHLGEKVVRFVPVAAAQAMYAPDQGTGDPFRILHPGPAALVLLGWVVVLLAAGGLVLWRRDP